MHSQPRRPTMPWAASPAVWPLGWGRGFCPSVPLWWDPTGSPASSSGALSTKKDMDLLEQSQRRPQQWSKGWSTSPRRKGWESSSCLESLEEEKVLGRPYSSLSVPEGAYKKAGEELFTRVCSYRTRGNSFKLKDGRFRLEMRQKFFIMRVVRSWHRLPREAVAAPSLPVFKARLDGALSNLVEGVPTHSRGVGTRRSLRSLPT